MLVVGFFIGFLGSLHCLGMCSPIALVMHSKGRGVRPILYNLGRTFTYIILGVLIGFVGEGANLLGLQRYISVAMGVLVILLAFRPGLQSKLYQSKIYASVLSPLRKRLLQSYDNQSHYTYLITGILNGFLPCGLVYIAVTAALTTPGVFSSVLLMLGFGLGTWPMMFAVGTAGKYLTTSKMARLNMVIPLIAVVLGAILITRALPIDIFHWNSDNDITICE